MGRINRRNTWRLSHHGATLQSSGRGPAHPDLVQLRDYTQIQATILIVTIVLVFVILATDISYAFVYPRIRYR